MKLLTLEEIERISANIKSQYYSDQDVIDLVATARAYWELKHQVSLSCKEGMRKKLFNDSVLLLYEKPARLPELADDKPHAPTVKAIVEAVHSAWDSEQESYDNHSFVKSLEKHLDK